MSSRPTPDAAGSAPPPPDFDPVSLRYRRDGWTPDRQVAFIRHVAECGCVREACRRVGMSPESAYEIARRPDAQSFRVAWDLAMDQAVRRAGDGAVARSINGVEIPHYYKGELVGTHRRYDERLTMFILRTRDPLRFGKHLERGEPIGSREDKALDFATALAWAKSDARREAQGRPRTVFPNLGAANDDGDEAVRRDMTHVYDFAPGVSGALCGEDEEDSGEEGGPVYEEEEDGREAGDPPLRAGSPSGPAEEPHLPPDVARTSSTSARRGHGANDGSEERSERFPSGRADWEPG